MSLSNYIIYQLYTDEDLQKIIDEFNKDKEDDKQFKPRENKTDIIFSNIQRYKLYTRAASSTPDWANPLQELVSDLDEIENINNSFVLFFQIETESYVATGGQGYTAIENHKNFNFGIDLLSRLIEINDNVIKSINDRHLAGNVIGGNSQYRDNVSLNMEKEFSSYLSKIYTALPSEIIENKFGIKIKTKKEDYRFLAKDSIKLSKSLTLSELDTFLGAISKLLKEKAYSINPVSYLNKKDPIISELDEKLIKKLTALINEPESEQNIRIIPFFNVFDMHYIQVGESLKESYETDKDIIRYLQKHISFDKESADMLAIIGQITLTSTIENGETVTTSLYNHLETNIMLNNKSYWLRDGSWLYIERDYDNTINDMFLTKITNHYDHSFNLEVINDWFGESEGDFNFEHNQFPSVYVLDRILYNNVIEICDLLINSNGRLYFVHVKDGINGDVRILANQIDASMRTIFEGINTDNQVLIDFYHSIINKIKDVGDNETDSQLSQSARKFQMDFPDEASFVDLIMEMKDKISFVFAYRPLKSHDFFTPSTIASTPAKLAMLHLVKEKEKYDFKLEFLKIKGNQ